MYLFAGPTLFERDVTGFRAYPPARLGSVYWAWRQGAKTIALVDGYFGTIPAVWHKELLYVISRGVAVWGAGSMGALRAAELAGFGMGGYGQVWQLYRDGVLADDDEVCVLHAPADHAYLPLTEAMVNVRATMTFLRMRNVIAESEEEDIIRHVKRLNFADRTRANIASSIQNVVGEGRSIQVWNLYNEASIDIKGDDAEGLLIGLRSGQLVSPTTKMPVFNSTFHWRRQFSERIDDLPPGNVDPHGLT